MKDFKKPARVQEMVMAILTDCYPMPVTGEMLAIEIGLPLQRMNDKLRHMCMAGRAVKLSSRPVIVGAS